MHFLQREAGHGQPAGAPRAMVTVRLTTRTQLTIQEGIGVCKANTFFVELPERIRVVDSGGEEIRPSPGRRFWVTAETFDPYHGLIERESS